MRYQLFGRHTGLRVSQVGLGSGNFGTGWGYGAEAAEVHSIFDGYLEAGGNLIDTADQYQFGQSESLVGDCIAANRDNLVLATKYSLGAAAVCGLGVTGNNRKNMLQSVEGSLRRLQTDRIDLLWVHMPDAYTPIDEIARGLDQLVRSGKVLYLGLSDFPAWRVARAATIAELRGWARIDGVQLEYSLVERSGDRELLPMAAGLGLGTVGWSPLGGGFLTGKYRHGGDGRATGLKTLVHAEDTQQKAAILDLLVEIANETGANTGQVAIAWVGSRGVIPILGPRSRAQLDDNLGAVKLTLTPEQIQRLDSVSAPELGFPHDFNAKEGNRQRLAGGQLAALDAPAQLLE